MPSEESDQTADVKADLHLHQAQISKSTFSHVAAHPIIIVAEHAYTDLAKFDWLRAVSKRFSTALEQESWR